ncbi:MAG: hypothetical protein ACI8V2_002784 [Candidatus Latescibacterota bacterium]|jgi:hypothetical protein
MPLSPLKLPNNFNPETHMIARPEGDKIYHAPRAAFELAYNLLTNGHTHDITQAEKTLEAALAGQETREGDPHLGNFLWEAEDEAVEDLNAVQFCLFQLIPIMIQYGNALSPDIQNKCQKGIRLGLEEIARIDVHPRYTNIVIKDITNTILGGEYLQDQTFKQRGYDKFHHWMAYTDRSGCPYEFNSPTYAGVALRVLKRLTELTQNETIRVRAEIMRSRIGLSSALHIHPATGRWAGPFSRAYRPTAACDVVSEIHTVSDWLAAGILPRWISNALANRPEKMNVVETADADNTIVLSTHHSPSFALGTATQELTSQANRFIAGQSNCFIVQHTTNDDHTGVIYSRYVLNEHWLGDFRSTPARSNMGLLFEEGQFHGVQQDNRAICLYAPRTLGAWETNHSAKAVIAWHRKEHVSGVWLNGKSIHTYPTPIPPNSTVVVQSGKTLTAIRPLANTDLGRNAPVHLIERDGHLCLEIYNFKGSDKTFWEQAHPGSFYQGQPQCGFYAEVAETSDWPNPTDFANAVASGTLTDEADPRVTYDEGVERHWSVAYTRDQKTVGIEIELMEWQLKRRWTHEGDLGTPMLDSPIAKQSRTGHIEIGDATLTCGQHPAWLFTCPDTNTYVAAYHGPNAAPLTLTLPSGKVEISSLTSGLIIWKNGEVTIDALDILGDAKITGGERK